MLVSEKITCISAYSSQGCSRTLFRSHAGNKSSFTPLSTKNSPILFRNKTESLWSTCCFSVALVTKKHKYFPGFCEAADGKTAISPTPGICFQNNLVFVSIMFWYSLLKSAANAVLNLMSVVKAIAHVLSVSKKSRSVSIMLLECSLGKLKYVSCVHFSYVWSLRSLSVSDSKSTVFLALFKFLQIKFSVRLIPTPIHRKK